MPLRGVIHCLFGPHISSSGNALACDLISYRAQGAYMKYDNKPCGETPINLCPPEHTPDLSGFIIVRLFAHVFERVQDLRRANKKLLPGITGFLERHREINTRRLISSVSPRRLLNMEKEAHASKFPPLHSLSTYWRLDYRGLNIHPHELLKKLQQLPEVDYAYLEKAVSDPAPGTANDPYARDQGYLDAARVGIDARWASTQPNGDGRDVGFIDLERAWNLNHEDLIAKAPTLIFADNREGVDGLRGDHGTSVLGIVGAVKNRVGIIGVAPGVRSIQVVSHYQIATGTENHVADAIVAAIRAMAPGDVLLLEVQRDYYPTETDVADFDAIRLATAAGIIVVEAAGNGNADLDALPAGVTFHGDSGAIMVGSCESALPHNRFVGLGIGEGSNYGSKINCFAWGQKIVTTGKGDLSGIRSGTDNDDYTRTFGGTSGAAAIIAGAALVVQGMYQAVPPVGGRLSPSQMRAILSDPTIGTPQGSGTRGNIGVMPNLRAILGTRLVLTPDVYLRDDISDTGVVPGIGSTSASPDIIVRSVREANPTASFGVSSGNSNTLSSSVEPGQDNFIYVRMKNRSRTAAANNTTATVYWSDASTLVTPDRWTLIGTSAPVNVPAGDTLVVADPIVWPAADVPAAAGDFCFVAILNQDSDLAPALPPAGDWDGFLRFMRNNNNVACRNFNVINELADSLALEFSVTGAPDTIRSFDLEIIQRLPSDANVVFEAPLALFTLVDPSSSLTADIDRKRQVASITLPHLSSVPIEDIQLSSGAEHRCRLILTNVEGITSGHSVAVRQIFEGQEVGRVTWFVQRTAPGPRPRRRR